MIINVDNGVNIYKTDEKLLTLLSNQLSQYDKSTLSQQEQNIFLRRYCFVEDAGVIASRYGMHRDAVNKSLSRTRKKLRAHLIQEGYTL